MGDAPLWHADHSLSFFSLYQILLCKKDTNFAEFIMIEYSLSQRPLPYSASGDLQATVCTASTGISFLPQSFTIAFNVIKGQRLHIEYISSYNILKARKCFSLMYWEGRVKRLVCVWADRKNTEDKHSYHSPASLTHRLNVFNIQPWTCCVTEDDPELLIFLYTLSSSHRYRELHSLDCKALVNRRWLF